MTLEHRCDFHEDRAMKSHAVPDSWRLSFEARLISHSRALQDFGVGITQLAWEVRDSEDPIVCADRTSCALDKVAAEWVRRCMRQLLSIDPGLDRYKAYDTAVSLWADYKDVDPAAGFDRAQPARVALFGTDTMHLSEGVWVERFMARVGKLTKAGQVDPVVVAERGKWAWLNMTSFSPEFVAQELYGDSSS